MCNGDADFHKNVQYFLDESGNFAVIPIQVYAGHGARTYED